MTPADTAKLLAKAAAFDQRTIGRADVAAWHEALADLDVGDALDAVTRHYQTSTDRLMPAHISRIADDIARQRRRDNQPAIEPPPPGIPLAQRSANGQIEQLRALLPAARAGILRRAEWYEHDRAKARHLTAVPNPDYDPAALIRLAETEEAS